MGKPVQYVLLFFVVIGCIPVQCSQRTSQRQSKSDSTEEKKMSEDDSSTFPVEKSEEEWKKQLSDMEYYVLREQGTEQSGTGDLLDVKETGEFTCAACGHELFHSSAKYESGTGWPSFWEPASDSSVKERPDNSLWRTRTEVICARCGGHLGHVFDDGPEPTGRRYCINSVALNFEKTDGEENGEEQ